MTLRNLKITILIGIVACNNNPNITDETKQKQSEDTFVNHETKQKEKSTEKINLENISKYYVDDYPVSEKMLKMLNANSLTKQSGNVISNDKAWFSNDTLNQTLVFELYTDYHRLVIYHFFNTDFPKDLIERIEFHDKAGQHISKNKKLNEINGFINQSTEIESNYFVSNKKIALGDTITKAIDIYGKPEKISLSDGIEKLEWQFIGEENYTGKTDLKGKPLAKNSFGNNIEMYFRNGKLIGQILFNDIP
jgi:hypothetical protein